MCTFFPPFFFRVSRATCQQRPARSRAGESAAQGEGEEGWYVGGAGGEEGQRKEGRREGAREGEEARKWVCELVPGSGVPNTASERASEQT
jgi:hypothetical protein